MIFDRPKSVILISPQAVPFTNRMLPKQLNVFQAWMELKKIAFFYLGFIHHVSFSLNAFKTALGVCKHLAGQVCEQLALFLAYN